VIYFTNRSAHKIWFVQVTVLLHSVLDMTSLSENSSAQQITEK